jgi:periplasmic divalent cation tolerance protein
MMELQEMVLIYSTFPDRKSADKVSREIVELRLAACANLFDGMKSVYEWQGKMQYDREVAVIFKTTPARRDELTQKIRHLHPYDVPAIIGFDASYVEKTYLSWLQAQTR